MRFLLKKLKKFWLALAVAGLLAAYYLTPLRSIFSAARQPLNFVGDRFFFLGGQARDLLANLKNLPDLQNDLKLKDEIIIDLLAKVSRLKEIERQDEELKKTISLKEEKNYNLITGKILNYRDFLGRRLVSLNLGRADQIAAGMPVIAAGNVLVGKITEVFEKTSLFLPVLDSQSLVAVSFLEHPEIQAVAAGRLGVSMTVDLIPQEADIKIGDLAVSSILENNPPPGLILGLVTDVTYQEEELFKKAALEPAIALSQLETVSVIIP